jgi:MFS family permease
MPLRTGTRPIGPHRGSVSALVTAAAFGGTFVGIASLALALGEHLQVPRAVALLTAGYGIGQVIGPLISRPLLEGGYSAPLLLAGIIVAAATMAAAALRIRYPLRLGSMIEPSRLTQELPQDLQAPPTTTRADDGDLSCQ